MDEPQPVPLGVVKELLEAELAIRENRLRCVDCGHFQPVPDEELEPELALEPEPAPEPKAEVTEGEGDAEGEEAEAVPEIPTGPACEECGSYRMNLIEQIQYEHKLALDHVRHLTRITRSEAEAVMAALDGLEHVDAYYAAKIADILPVHPDDVRAIFARERFSVGSDEIEAIIAAVQENTEA